MRHLSYVFLILVSFGSPAWSATFDFDIVARIDSAFLRPVSDNGKVPVGGVLRGRMTYSFPSSQQFGSDYYYAAGLETLSISTAQGFALTLDNRVTVVSSNTTQDTLIAQSFISEDPNGWNMVFDITAMGWLGGSNDLPSLFPDRFQSAYISAYFLDEFDIIQSVEATILAITPADGILTPVPLPPAGLFLGGLMLVGAGSVRLQRRSRC